MRKQTEVERKLQVLKDLLTGDQDFSILRPPQHYCIIQNTDGLYQIPGIDLLHNKEMLEQWMKTVRQCDSVIVFEYDGRYGNTPLLDSNVVVFKEEKTYDDGSSVAVETLDTDYVEVDPLPVEVAVDKKPQRKTERRKEAVNEPQEVFRPVGLIPRNIRQGKLSLYGIEWGSICD